jgi:quercetin dioxygenase-like cupin family protein
MSLNERFSSSRVLAVLVCLAAGAQAPAAPQPASYVSPGGTTLRILLDKAALGGGEVEVGEITFQPGADSGDHVHGATEIFYVLSGELEHVVNGKSVTLGPGMIGHVRPPDNVRHRVPGKAPVKALVIWAPGGEAERITSRWRRQD